VVLGFNNFSGEPELEWLGTALAEMLSNELWAGGELRPVPGESVSRMRRDLELAAIETLSPETLEKVRDMVGARFLVLGSYTGGGEEAAIHLTLQLQQTTGRGLKTRKVEAPDLFTLATKAGGVLREMLELGALSAGAEEAVRASMGANEETARLYVEGLVHLRSFDALAARDALEQAVKSDAGFALAHAALSDVYQLMGYESEAVASARRASELSADLTREQQLWIEARYHEAAGSWGEAIKTWQALWEFWPDDLEYGLRLARAQTTAGRGQEAMKTLQALRELPLPAGDDPRIDLEAAGTAGSMLAWRQKVDAATEARRKGMERNARSLVAEAELLRGEALYQINEMFEAEKSLGKAQLLFRASKDEVKGAKVSAAIANLRQTQGRSAEARQLFEGALEIQKKVGNRKGQADVENNLAFLIQDAGDFATAEAGARRAVEIAQEIGARHDEALYVDTLTWILLGQSKLEKAESSAQEVQRLYGEIGSVTGMAWAHFYLGQVAFARGELEAAQEDHEKALGLAERAEDGYVAGFVLDGLAGLALTRDELAAAEAYAADDRVVASEVLAWVHLAQDDLSGAQANARLVSSFHSSQGNLVSQAGAEISLAAALHAKGDRVLAREILDRWYDTIAQKPTLRLRAKLLMIHLEAPKVGLDQALAQVEKVRLEASDLALKALEFEALLVAGKLELAAGRTRDGRQHLTQLAQDAESIGYRLLARQARAQESLPTRKEIKR
jgi:tetratricopeptide (TPR) repeat protein